jgi:hypothetical protein
MSRSMTMIAPIFRRASVVVAKTISSMVSLDLDGLRERNKGAFPRLVSALRSSA